MTTVSIRPAGAGDLVSSPALVDIAPAPPSGENALADVDGQFTRAVAGIALASEVTAAAQTAETPESRRRLWLSGTVAVEPREPGQGQPFAVWHLSDLRAQVGYGDQQPAGYAGVHEVSIKEVVSDRGKQFWGLV